MGNRRQQYLTIIAGDLLILVVGVTLGWPSPYLQVLMDENSPLHASSDAISWCIVMPIIGVLFGDAMTSFLLDKVGRKYYVTAQAPAMMINLLLIAFFENFYVLSAARFLIGVSEGALFSGLPIYYGEIADPKIRGATGSSIMMSLFMGILLINSIGPFTTVMQSSLITTLFPIISFVLMCCAPESPYYHIKNGEQDKARKCLVRLRGSEEVAEEISEIAAGIFKQEESMKTRYVDLLAVASYRKGIMISCGLSFCNKFSGMFPMMFYTELIFKMADGSIQAIESTILYTLASVLSTLCSLLLIDRFGRRPLFMISVLGCALTLSTEASYFTIQKYAPELLTNIKWLPLTALIAYTVLFNVGISFLPLVILTELFPTAIKTKACGVADATSIIMGIATSKLFHSTAETYGIHVPFWIFSGCCVVGFILGYFIVPETKGKTLEEIQTSLRKL